VPRRTWERSTTAALWVAFAKRRIDIACTVQDAHDVDPVTDRQVEDELPAERETPDSGGEFVAGAPHERLRGQKPKLGVKLVDPVISGIRVVAGDEIPDPRNVLGGFRSA
jgi:hypothetical protein